MKILIIGAGPGLSRGVATLFGGKGFSVTLISRDERKLKQEAELLETAGIKADYVAADAGDEKSFNTVIARFTAPDQIPDVILYNAFMPVQKGIAAESWNSIKEQLDVNVGGAFNLLKSMLPVMLKQDKGKLFFTGGGFGIAPHPDFVGLSMGKAALRNLVQSVAKEIEDSNVHMATVTVYGSIGGPEPKYAPDAVARVFWELFTQSPDEFKAEVIY